MSPTDERGFEISCMSPQDRCSLIDRVSDKVDCLGYSAIAPAVKENIRGLSDLCEMQGTATKEIKRVHERMDGLAKDIPLSTFELSRKGLRITNLSTQGVRFVIISLLVLIYLQVNDIPLHKILQRIQDGIFGVPTNVSFVTEENPSDVAIR